MTVERTWARVRELFRAGRVDELIPSIALAAAAAAEESISRELFLFFSSPIKTITLISAHKHSSFSSHHRASLYHWNHYSALLGCRQSGHHRRLELAEWVLSNGGNYLLFSPSLRFVGLHGFTSPSCLLLFRHTLYFHWCTTRRRIPRVARICMTRPRWHFCTLLPGHSSLLAVLQTTALCGRCKGGIKPCRYKYV